MFRAISSLRSPLRVVLPQTLTTSSSISSSSLCSNPNLLSSIKVPFDHSPPLIFSNPTAPAISIFSSPFSTRQKNEDPYDDDYVYSREPKSPPKLFVVQPRFRPDEVLNAKLSEALNLAHSLEEERDGDFGFQFGDKELPPHIIVQNPASRSSKTRADMYFGPGTVDTVKCHLNAYLSEESLMILFLLISNYKLQRAWGKPVLDRVGLIIEIFNAHAQTKEAKLQSELAALMYKKTRLVRVRGAGGRLTFGETGEAEVVSARGRGSGGRGFISGAGETELQLQRRRILERRNRLLTEIEEVRRTRALQRASRKRRGGSEGQGLATIAVVGYTNAGKSTLVSALSDSYLYSDDRLFATVDPLLRNVILPSGRKVLLSDTVGFISDLPVQLVEAFHATLEEVVEADLLVHVIDSSALNVDEQRSSVLQVLQQIGVSEDKLQNMIEVWNKVDLLRENAGCDEFVDEGEGEDEDDDADAEEEEFDEEAELSSKESLKEDAMASGLSAGENLEPVDDQEDDFSEGWETVDEDAQQDNVSKGLNSMDYQQVESTESSKIINPDSHFQREDVQRVETSAVMGVGLQELLHIIDEKLSSKKVVERRSVDCFDRKWRPPREVDAGAAVEQ
ncbi:GTP binding domain [Macleaya cordata]|uniref:GTP binding domain n=1 Tax=Macleaya cordata TaxID=56857 RepID=A0A200Q9Y7_MACCD|nr:GTP binding domain [Macleaya cordata]